MPISYDIKGEYQYAKLYKSKRIGKKVVKVYTNLGRESGPGS
jgi:hypothetical protein